MGEQDSGGGETLVEVFGHVLGAIDRTMLATGASAVDDQARESALEVGLDRGIDEAKDVADEGLHGGFARRALFGGE